MALTTLGKVSELSRQSVQCVQLDDQQYVLIHQQQQFYLLDNLCPHKAAALCEGELLDGAIECPWHKARFDIRDGHGLSPLAGDGVKSYILSQINDELMVDLT